MWHHKRHFPGAQPTPAELCQQQGRHTVCPAEAGIPAGAFRGCQGSSSSSTWGRAGSVPRAGAAGAARPCRALRLPQLLCSVRKRSVKGSGPGARELREGTCAPGLRDTKCLCHCAGLSSELGALAQGASPRGAELRQPAQHWHSWKTGTKY